MRKSIKLMSVGAWVLLLFGCGQNPRIDVVPEIENGRVVFKVPHSGINGILSFRVMEGDKDVWIVLPHYETGHRIVYGELPTGGNMPAEQTVPAPGQPLPDIRGKSVTVRITYQFDSRFSACSGQFEKAVVIP
jgi:hypothetical protein